jgi:hypothetical protein
LQFIHYLVPTQIVISGTSSITLSASTDSSSQSYSLVLPKLKGTPYLKLENNDTGQMIWAPGDGIGDVTGPGVTDDPQFSYANTIVSNVVIDSGGDAYTRPFHLTMIYCIKL